MTRSPTPAEIFDRAVREGDRRLDQSLLELVSTSFIAGFTIVFGIVALGIVHAIVEPRYGELARLAGALAFGVGLVFLVVGRAELFTENFFDPTAAVIEHRDAGLLGPLCRLWLVTFVFNLFGGSLFALVFAIDGALPPGTAASLIAIADESAHRPATASFARAITGGALITLLSFLLLGVESSGSRIVLSYVVGFLLALGPFDHVVVFVLHGFLGMMFGAEIGLGTLAATTAVVTAGNTVGGFGLVTFTHAAQAIGAHEN